MNPQYPSLQELYIWEAFLLTLKVNTHQRLSTVVLKKMGFQHPPQQVHYLKTKKLIRIKTTYQTVTNTKGDFRKGIASYCLDMGA